MTGVNFDIQKPIFDDAVKMKTWYGKSFISATLEFEADIFILKYSSVKNGVKKSHFCIRKNKFWDLFLRIKFHKNPSRHFEVIKNSPSRKGCTLWKLNCFRQKKSYVYCIKGLIFFQHEVHLHALTAIFSVRKLKSLITSKNRINQPHWYFMVKLAKY